MHACDGIRSVAEKRIGRKLPLVLKIASVTIACVAT